VILPLTRRVSRFRSSGLEAFDASDLARVVADGVTQYGEVTTTDDGTDWLLTAPARLLVPVSDGAGWVLRDAEGGGET